MLSQPDAEEIRRTKRLIEIRAQNMLQFSTIKRQPFSQLKNIDEINYQKQN